MVIQQSFGLRKKPDQSFNILGTGIGAQCALHPPITGSAPLKLYFLYIISVATDFYYWNGHLSLPIFQLSTSSCYQLYLQDSNARDSAVQLYHARVDAPCMLLFGLKASTKLKLYIFIVLQYDFPSSTIFFSNGIVLITPKRS